MADEKQVGTLHTIAKTQVETLHFGWNWQVWTEEIYPGPHWEFWMKCCPRCYKGPLTGVPDAEYELCDDCEYATTICYERKVAADAIEELRKRNEAMLAAMRQPGDELACVDCGDRKLSTKPCSECETRFCLKCQRRHLMFCEGKATAW